MLGTRPPLSFSSGQRASWPSRWGAGALWWGSQGFGPPLRRGVAGQAGFQGQSEAGGHSSLALGRGGGGRAPLPAGPELLEAAETTWVRERGWHTCGPSTSGLCTAVGRDRHAGLGEVSDCTVAVPSWGLGKGREVPPLLSGSRQRCPGGSPPICGVWIADSRLVLCGVGCPRGPPELRVGWTSWSLNRVPHRVGGVMLISSLPAQHAPCGCPMSLPVASACSSCPCMWSAPAPRVGPPGAHPSQLLLFRA